MTPREMKIQKRSRKVRSNEDPAIPMREGHGLRLEEGLLALKQLLEKKK